VQALTPLDHRANVVFSSWLLEKCVVKAQFVADILLTDEAGFTRDGFVNFHYPHAWMDDDPHVTVAPKHQQKMFHQCLGGNLG
jgi:hypothetical protein